MLEKIFFGLKDSWCINILLTARTLPFQTQPEKESLNKVSFFGCVERWLLMDTSSLVPTILDSTFCRFLNQCYCFSNLSKQKIQRLVLPFLQDGFLFSFSFLSQFLMLLTKEFPFMKGDHKLIHFQLSRSQLLKDKNG